MGRSYLYPGRDVEHLSPTERMLERLYDQIDRPGNRITPSQFFSSPEAAQLLDQQFGGLSDRIPPGSQIINQTPSRVTYRDADGYEHTLTRKPDGEVTEASNRPAILPNRGQQQFTEQLQSKLQSRLNQPTQFASLPPELQQQLDAISAAERGDIQKPVSYTHLTLPTILRV